MTPEQIREAVNTKLAAIWAAIQSKQDAFFATNGRFWQGILTHNVHPADGNETVPTIGTTCPSDQLGQPWPASIRNNPHPMALQMDCYNGPAGVGYVATVYVRIGGNVWTRAAQVGPETWRQYGWRQLG